MQAPAYAVRMYAAEDYATIAPWWPAHGWQPVAQAVLPRGGVVVELDGRPVAAAWLYMDNSVGVAMMEWTVTNPDNTPRQSLKAITLLVGAIREIAVQNDYGVVLTSAKQDSLVKVYAKNGFQKTDSGMTHLLMLTKTA